MPPCRRGSATSSAVAWSATSSDVIQCCGDYRGSGCLAGQTPGDGIHHHAGAEAPEQDSVEMDCPGRCAVACCWIVPGDSPDQTHDFPDWGWRTSGLDSARGAS